MSGVHQNPFRQFQGSTEEVWLSDVETIKKWMLHLLKLMEHFRCAMTVCQLKCPCPACVIYLFYFIKMSASRVSLSPNMSDVDCSLMAIHSLF